MQNDKHDDNIDVDELIRQGEEYDENKLLFWVICHVLSFLSLVNLNMYIIHMLI